MRSLEDGMKSLLAISLAFAACVCWLQPASSQDGANAETGSGRILEGHLDSVTMAAFASQGASIVTGSFDQSVRLWDLDTQSELRQYAQHTGPVFCLSVSGDGTTLVTGAQDNTLRIWDLPLGTPKQRLDSHPDRVNAIALNPVTETLVSVSNDRKIRLNSLGRNAESFQERAEHNADVLSVDVRSDGASFATGDADGRVVLWSPFLPSPQAELTVQGVRVSHVQFLPNNQQLVSTGADGFVRIWQVGVELGKTIDLAGKKIVDWSLTPNRTEAICIDAGGRVFVLNLSNGEVKTEYPKLAVQPTHLTRAPNLAWVGVTDDSGGIAFLKYNDGSLIGNFSGHQGRINDVTAHPDSTRLATCGEDGQFRLWAASVTEGETPEPLQVFRGDSDATIAATAVAFTTDQRDLIGGTADGKIHQWKLADGQLIRSIETQSGAIRNLAVTPNGQVLISVSEDQQLRTWKLADGSELQTIKMPEPVESLSISPDSSRVAVAFSNGVVQVRELNTGFLLETFADKDKRLAAVGYLADGRGIVFTGAGGKLHVAATSIVRAFPVCPGAVRSAAIYGGGSQLLSCGDDDEIRMTNLSDGAEVRVYRVADGDSVVETVNDDGEAADNDPAGLGAKPTVVAVRSDNQRVVSGTESGAVFVWNANAGETPLLTLQLDTSVTAICYSPDNQKLAVATSAPAVHIFGPPPPGTTNPLELTEHQRFATDAKVLDLKFASDNESVWASLEDGQIQRWKYAGIAMRRQLNHSGPVYGVVVSNDGRRAVSCSTDQTLRVWNTVTGQQEAQLRGHVGAVHAVAMSPDESLAVSSGADGSLRLWDIVGGRQLKQLATFDQTMYSIAIHPDGKQVAAAGADRKIHLLDILTGREIKTLEGHQDYIHCVAFDHTGRRLLSYGYAGYLRIWDNASGKMMKEVRIGNVGNYAQFSPDGESILLANGDGTARVIPIP